MEVRRDQGYILDRLRSHSDHPDNYLHLRLLCLRYE